MNSHSILQLINSFATKTNNDKCVVSLLMIITPMIKMIIANFTSD